MKKITMMMMCSIILEVLMLIKTQFEWNMDLTKQKNYFIKILLDVRMKWMIWNSW